MGMGSPADGVANVAKDENVDLIIMGSKELEKEGNNKLKLLGNVTRRVSEISDRPVMIVSCYHDSSNYSDKAFHYALK
jgi:nucleotide-binding universal stress UspA family protein